MCIALYFKACGGLSSKTFKSDFFFRKHGLLFQNEYHCKEFKNHFNGVLMWSWFALWRYTNQELTVAEHTGEAELGIAFDLMQADYGKLANSIETDNKI